MANTMKKQKKVWILTEGLSYMGSIINVFSSKQKLLKYVKDDHKTSDRGSEKFTYKFQITDGSILVTSSRKFRNVENGKLTQETYFSVYHFNEWEIE